MFGIGKPHPKSGSPHIWVYAISGYKNMFKHVFPFYYNYVLAFGCKIPEFEMFHAICVMLEKGEHETKEGLIKMVRLAYTVQGKGKWRKRTLEEVLEIIEKRARKPV